MLRIWTCCTLFACFALCADAARGPRSSRITARHLEYQGIGFDEGYTTLQLFLANPEGYRDAHYFFLDARAHIFNNGKPACNAGFGWRFLFDSACDSIGCNFYYDFRKTSHMNYNQGAFGLEYLSPKIECRANGYLPFGKKVSPIFDLEFSHFAGNNFYVSRKHEYAMGGADAEIGWHCLQKKKIDLFVGAGPYYFKGHAESAIGGKIRIKGRFTPFVSLEVTDSYDAVFKNRFQAEFALSLPFGPRSKPKPDKCCSCESQNWMQEWAHDPPNRQEIIVVDKKKKTSLGIDPITGNPFFLIFVNNLSSSNGTFESPFPTLAQAEAASLPGDTIYVFAGDGSTNGMGAGILLKNSQRLLGSGVPHNYNTTVGNVAIPTQTVKLPAISSAGPVVTIARDNEVAGFEIYNGTTGIISDAASWAGGAFQANINRNQIFYTAGIGISLAPVNSQVQIRIQNNGIIEQDQQGIQIIASTGSQADVNVSSNNIDNTILDNILIASDDFGTRVTSLIENNTIVGRKSQTNVMSKGSLVKLETRGDSYHISQVVKNRLAASSAPRSQRPGIHIQATTTSTGISKSISTISNNEVINTFNGILLEGESAALGPIEALISENRVEYIHSATPVGPSPLTGAAISILSNTAGSYIKADIFKNFVDNSAHGIQDMILLDGSQHDLTIRENQIFNCPTGMLFQNDGTENIWLERNIVVVNHENLASGIQIFPGTFSGVTGFTRAIVTENQISGYSESSFQGIPVGSASLCLRLVGNVADNQYTLGDINGTGFVFLEPPINNAGAVTLAVPITHVETGTCD